MDKKWALITILVTTVVVIIEVALVMTDNMPHTYEIDEVFYTEQEYHDFKMALIEYDASYNADSLSILNNTPPIIVRGNITNINYFPYGTNRYETVVFIPLGVLILGFFISKCEYWAKEY